MSTETIPPVMDKTDKRRRSGQEIATIWLFSDVKAAITAKTHNGNFNAFVELCTIKELLKCGKLKVSQVKKWAADKHLRPSTTSRLEVEELI
jgi:hypothetical protein